MQKNNKSLIYYLVKLFFLNRKKRFLTIYTLIDYFIYPKPDELSKKGPHISIQHTILVLYGKICNKSLIILKKINFYQNQLLKK